MSDADEKRLVERLRAGERAAYEELVRSQTGRLLAVARRMLRSEEDAQDAVQEAFVNAFRGLARFDGEAQLSTWLHRIAVNACLMRLRSRRRRAEEPIEPLLPTFYADGQRREPGPAWQQDAVAALESAERRRLVRACINELPESYRTVLLLRDIEALDTQETALALGIKPEAVKMRLHIAANHWILRLRTSTRGASVPRTRP